MRYALLACTLFLGCGNNPQTGDGGPSLLDVVAGWSGSPTMNPGLDCLSCHSAANSGDCPSVPCRASDRPWTVAGTVFPGPDAGLTEGLSGVQVLIVDGAGAEFTLTSNAAGNFYTAETLQFPLRSIQMQNQKHRLVMNLDPSEGLPLADGYPMGSCNACHTVRPQYTAPGRLFIPPD